MTTYQGSPDDLKAIAATNEHGPSTAITDISVSSFINTILGDAFYFLNICNYTASEPHLNMVNV